MFDIEEDAKYPYFCEACLTGIADEDNSPDARYCQGCYDFLLKEVDSLDRVPKWALRVPQKPKREPVKQDSGVAQKYIGGKTRGRPKMNNVPPELIHDLSKRGLSARGIARELGEQGITVSRVTVGRVLSGTRF